MEVEIEPEQVLEDVARHLANGFLGHTGEDRVSEFLEEGGSDSGGAVCLVRTPPLVPQRRADSQAMIMDPATV